ncbi:protein SCAI isoform X1 [Oryza brachyantha]|uniref:protein SCAI isoform X1 n=1 Tax=Oryza brachyantha TaxID=4533 RepID=UPI001ADABB01|nr:protein SCAI isoform X1 [Oryza brachyantha]
MASSPHQGQAGGGGGWTAEQFWSLLDKADRRFARVRDLPIFGRREPEEYGKAFRIYTQLWRMQQEHRHRLLDAGLRRWQVGEIAARIAHLYYSQYQRASDTALLSEAFVFYHAVLDRGYFIVDAADHLAPTKHLRFLARFLLVALLLARRSDTVPRLAAHIRTLLDDSKKTLQEAEYKEWKHVVQEIARFLRADSLFMNMRPLRYSYAFDPAPDTLPTVPPTVKKRGLVLSDAMLCSYYHNEVKFTDITIDVFRMLQCLEWEPCGSFALSNGYSAHDESGQNHPNLLKDLRDAALPPNPLKTILYRPSVTHFLTVLATKCEELPSNGMMLIYLSAAGEVGPSGFCADTNETVVSSFNKFDISNVSTINVKEDDASRLWLGYSEGEEHVGSNCIYPCDLIPFTRRPLFLVIDSNTSYSFKSIHGFEKGETTAMLLSPSCRSSSLGFSGDSVRQIGSQFTMFLTAPLQAFCHLIGNNGVDIDRDAYKKAEELLSLSLNEWAATLVASSSLHPVWVEVLGDLLLRRLLLRFIFCRAAHSLFKLTYHKVDFLPTCAPPLPQSVDAESMLSQSCLLRVASFLGAANQFSFAEVTTWPEVDAEEATVANPSI